MVASSPRSNPTSSPGTQATPEEVAAAAEQARTEIEAAQQNDDVISEPESGYSSDDGGSVTTSVSSSVRDYNFENGRRYHKYCEGRCMSTPAFQSPRSSGSYAPNVKAYCVQ